MGAPNDPTASNSNSTNGAAQAAPKTSARRALPHALDAERSVIGGVLLDPKAFIGIAALVSPEDFYHQAHSAIFQAIVDLDVARKPIDEISIGEQMRSDGSIVKLRAFNGEAYFAELTSAVISVENIAWHARMVRGKAQMRRAIETAQEIAAAGFGEHEDVDDFLANAAQRLANLAEGGSEAKYQSARIVVTAAMHGIEKRYDAKQELRGIASGFPSLDEKTAGFVDQDLILLAARPSMGKTALAMAFADYAAINLRIPVFVASLEMEKVALMERQLASRAQVDFKKIRRSPSLGRDDWARLIRASSVIADASMELLDGSFNAQRLRAQVRKWRFDPNGGARLAGRRGKDDLGEALVLVDYIGRIQTSGRNERHEREVAEVSSALKNIAQELRLPVIALSQLARGVEQRPNKRPMPSDLRDSGALEQDADLILLLYRDEVYNKETKDRGIAEVIIGKQRNGETGTVRLRWRGDQVRFESLAEDEEEDSQRRFDDYKGPDVPPPDDDDEDLH